MSEKFREIFDGERQKSIEFDREAEKKHRQEIRKALGRELSEALNDFGFKKTGYSLWSRKIGELWQIVYLQRSQFSHHYYIEAGICNERDVPKGEKLNIVFCKKRERIEGMVASIAKKQIQKKENSEEEIRKKVDDINKALNFEISSGHEKSTEEYFVPSVSSQEAKEKITKIMESVKEYIPSWFDTQSKNKGH